MAKTRKRERALTIPDPTRRDPSEAAPQAAGDTTAAAPDRARIATRAYELYLARGGAAGRDLDDWLTAEQELKSASAERTRE